MSTVAIIGGGMAGLYAAEVLATRGFDVTVFEKSAVWGGRVLTYRTPQIQYEIGAGRIYAKHARMRALVDRFKLTTYPITTHTAHETPAATNTFLDLFEPVRRACESVPVAELRNHTIADIVPDALRPILKMYPYWAEIHMLRADSALALFRPKQPMGARGTDDYYGIVEGIDALATHLKTAAAAAGATLRANHTVRTIERRSTDNMFEITGVASRPFTYTTHRVILATCRCSLTQFRTLLNNAPLLRQIGTSPLMRIYAVYPPNPTTGTVWFAGLPKIVTSNPLRYVIPIDAAKGLIMISYTDGADTDYWRQFTSDDQLRAAIQTSVRVLFPAHMIPEPTYLKRHDWTGGCSYWLPGDYDVADAIEAARNPAPGVYVIGESVSATQTWVEGALESAEALLDNPAFAIPPPRLRKI